MLPALVQVNGVAYSLERASFSSLWEEWAALLPSSVARPVFSGPHFQCLWWQHFGGGQELHLLSVRREGRLVGVAPLVQKNGWVSLLGSTEVCDYLDIIAGRDDLAGVLTLLWRYLDGLAWQQLVLASIPEESPTLSLLPASARAEGLGVRVILEDRCPGLDLPSSWEEYLAHLGKHERHELRRKLRRLDSEVPWRCYAVTGGEDLDRAMVDFFRLHRLSAPEKAFFMTEEMRRFFTDLSEMLAQERVLRPYFLEIEGERAATALCFDTGAELWLYNSGYDLAYQRYAAGLLLKALCLKDAIACGKSRFDFLRGGERYKYDLGASDRRIFRIEVTRP